MYYLKNIKWIIFNGSGMFLKAGYIDMLPLIHKSENINWIFIIILKYVIVCKTINKLKPKN